MVSFHITILMEQSAFSNYPPLFFCFLSPFSRFPFPFL